jgi:hypothetical protein
MMPHAEDGKTLAEVQAEVQRACDLLRSPTPAAVDRCSIALASAISRLVDWSKRFHGGDRVSNRLALEEARRLRASVHRAAGLLESAAAYHAGWRKALGSLCAGYTASGAPADAAPPGRLCMRG